MRRLIIPLLISAFLCLTLLPFATEPGAAQEPPKGSEPVPALSPPGPDAPSPSFDRQLLPKIEPQLLKKLLETDQPIPFLVYLKATTDLSATVASVSPGVGNQGQPDPLTRRTAIVNALQATARNTQNGVLQTLRAPASTGNLNAQAAGDITPLWIVNAVAARGSLATVLALAAREDVEIIRLDKELNLAPASHKSAELGNSQRLFLTPVRQTSEWGVAKIRADLVHTALNIDGSGVVVANIDSGVDWQHPALQSKYRGYTGAGKLAQHTGNWYDATGEGSLYPVDGNGHGTHTMGTAVGAGGIGVAPGASWIAVRAFDSSGTALNSWLHQAFQWVLAPNGDPALAPDVVNNSWGNNFGASTEFAEDVQALLTAGIFPVFSAGNNGPEAATVSSPGSLTSAFAVGATTIDDEIANFSSRGPSPWGEIKPEVSAPGQDVRSSLPGGAYGELDGTSMAAPHASGLAALLLQTAPTLATDLNAISEAMKNTAVRSGSPIPNNDYGWGRIDAYNAVMAVASVGTLQGQVTQAGGLAINNALIQISAHNGGPYISTQTNAAGEYLQGLAANTYDATATAFGYESASAFGLQIVTSTATTQDFVLTPKPTGTLSGIVREAGTGTPLTATILVEGTPASTTSGFNGAYSLVLPTGTYTVSVVASRHRITRAVNITVNDGATVEQNFWLNPAPAILLVDSGRWYQESQISYYEEALEELLYPYDLWEITDPFGTPDDIPTTATLTNYDLVIWSSPLDSPGYIGADDELAGFLDNGGKLLLSGQDIAFYDGGGSIFGAAPYFNAYLKAAYVQDDSGQETVRGDNQGPFDTLELMIAGEGGADNQATPDVIANNDSDFAGPLLRYGDNSLAGLHIGLCVPYRALFLAFGYEGISSGGDRVTVMDQAIDWLVKSPDQTGVELSPLTKTIVGNFGTVAAHSVRVRNTGTAADTLNLAYSSRWPVNPAPPANLTLASCQAQTVTLGVTVNTNTWHVSDTLTVTAQSTTSPTMIATAIRVTKSPAPVLLVDDDRWYSFAAEYREALEANNVPYDYWLVPKSWSGPVPPSPPLSTLQMYPMTVWYTAYDWFQPLTTEEENRLANYLEGGGRLLLSSQDYIYNLPDREPGPFAQDYLGVLDHTEDYSSTLIVGEPGNPVGNLLGPYSLTFPPGYNNWTDALTPTITARIATRGQAGQPNGVTHAGAGSGDWWHTLFMAYGPELLDLPERTRLMQRSLGWLSWLGRSTVVSNRSTALDGGSLIYTATLRNDGWEHLSTTHFTATRPAGLTWGSYSSNLAPSGDNLVWTGSLAKDESKVVTYTAAVDSDLPLGTIISQTSWLAYPDHSIVFDRVVEVKVNFPDLSSSAMSVTPTQGVEPGDPLAYTIVLKNTGLVDDPMVTMTNTLPHMLELMGIDSVSGGNVQTVGKTVTWTTPLARDEVATLTYRAVISYRASTSIVNRAYASDSFNEPVELAAQAFYKISPIYLPIIFKK